MFVRLTVPLSQFAKRPEIVQKFKEKELQGSWEEIIKTIHENAQGKSRILQLTKDGELVIEVLNHLWLQELSLYREDIRDRVLRQHKNIKSVRLVVLR